MAWARRGADLRVEAPGQAKKVAMMDETEADVLAYMAFPARHRTRLPSTNPLERLNKEAKRRAEVVGIFPNKDSILRRIGAVLFEPNDDWQSQPRCMMVEAFSQIDPLLAITTQAA